MCILKRIIFYIGYLRIKRQAKTSGMYFPFGKFYPCLNERKMDSGSASGHYFHQDLLDTSSICKD